MDRISIILKQIRESFYVTDTQIIFFFVVIICFAAALIIAPIIISSMWKRGVRDRARALYEEQVEYFQLDGDEEKIIDRLSRYLKYPWKKYLLITNPRAYVSALKNMYAEYERFKTVERALSQKILTDEHDQNQMPAHTSQFRKNHQIILICENKPIIARIAEIDDSGFLCEYERGSQNLRPGMSALLLYPYGNGLAVGTSVVDKTKDANIKLIAADMDTPEQIDYSHFSIPVYVRKVSLKSGFIHAQLRQISGMEFFLQVTGHSLKKGDDVKIYFSKEKGSVPVNAEITVSRKAQVIADAGYFIQKE